MQEKRGHSQVDDVGDVGALTVPDTYEAPDTVKESYCFLPRDE